MEDGDRDYAQEEVAPEEAEVPEAPPMQAVAAVESEFDTLIREDEPQAAPPAESRKRVHEEEEEIKSAAIAPPPAGGPFICIDNLVRPFTESALRQLINATGTVIDCWMPKFKTHAVVQVETQAQAEATKAAIEGLRWPHGTNKILTVKDISEQDAVNLKAGAAISALADIRPRPDVVASVEKGKRGGIAAATAKMARDSAGHVQGGVNNPKERVRVTEKEGSVLPPPPPRLGIIAEIKEGLRRKGPGGEDERGVEQGVDVRGSRKEEEMLNLDDLFRKTTAKPSIYWLPVK